MIIGVIKRGRFMKVVQRESKAQASISMPVLDTSGYIEICDSGLPLLFILPDNLGAEIATAVVAMDCERTDFRSSAACFNRILPTIFPTNSKVNLTGSFRSSRRRGGPRRFEQQVAVSTKFSRSHGRSRSQANQLFEIKDRIAADKAIDFLVMDIVPWSGIACSIEASIPCFINSMPPDAMCLNLSKRQPSHLIKTHYIDSRLPSCGIRDGLGLGISKIINYDTAERRVIRNEYRRAGDTIISFLGA